MENFKPDDDLKPFFDALKEHSSEPVSIEQVRQKLMGHDKTRKIKLNIMTISTIISIAAAIALFSSRTDVQEYKASEVAQAEKTQALKPEKTPHTLHYTDDVVSGPDEKKQNPVNVAERHPNTPSVFKTPFVAIGVAASPIAAMPQDTLSADSSLGKLLSELLPMLKQNEDVSPDPRTFEFPFSVVKLSVEELEKLGIYSGGGAIFYESNIFGDEPFEFYYMPGMSSMSFDEDNEKLKDHFPVLLTDRCFTHVITMPYFMSYKTPHNEIKAVTKDLIPVVAYANATPGITFYEEQIFWFKKTEDIIGQMPVRVQQDIRDNKYVWDASKDSVSFSPEMREREKRIATEFNEQREEKPIEFNPANAIYADAELLKMLNIRCINKTSFVDYEYKSVSYKHHIYISPKTGDTSVGFNINTGNEKDIERAQKKRKTPLFRFSHQLPFNPLKIQAIGNGSNSHNNYTPYQDYMLKKHALIPVIVTLPRNKGQYVYWYYPTPNFMKLLNDGQLQTAALYLEQHKHDSMLLSRFIIEKNYPKKGTFNDLRRTSEPAFPFTKLEFDSLTLNKLGIVVHDKSVSYFFKADNTYMETNFSKRGTQIRFDKQEGVNYATNTALIITDDLGRYPRMTLDSIQINNIDFNTLVPVYAKTNDVYTNVDKLRKSWRPDVIFWYKPDSSFLSLLPSRISVPMASDMKMLETRSGGGSCTYFDVCKSKTPNISNYRFYPNPAKDLLNIDLQTIAATSLTLKLFDVAGKQVIETVSFETTGNKLNSHIDISALPPGIYNVVLETLNGDKIISRIIIMH